MRRLVASVVVLATVLAAACTGDGREDGADGARQSRPPLADLPVPRTEVAGATWLGQPAVAGGLTPDGAASALVHLFDTGAGVWRPGPDLPLPLHHAGMAAFGDRLYVAGGYTNGPDQSWRPQSRVFSLGAGEPAWREEAPLARGPRGALGLAAAGDLLVAVGGEANGRPLPTTEIYDPRRRAWRPGPDLARPREHLAVAASAGRVYAVAGRTLAEGNLRLVESFEPATGTSWRREPDLNDARGGIGADTVAGRVCVAGGEEPAGTIASVECLEGQGWRRVARLARPRHGLAVMAVGSRLHVVAGGERPGLFVSGAHEALTL